VRAGLLFGRKVLNWRAAIETTGLPEPAARAAPTSCPGHPATVSYGGMYGRFPETQADAPRCNPGASLNDVDFLAVIRRGMRRLPVAEHKQLPMDHFWYPLCPGVPSGLRTPCLKPGI